jgi:FHA domain
MANDAAEHCPQCREPRIGLFCERCGHTYVAMAEHTPPSWWAVIAPDREYFKAGMGRAEQFTFPANDPPRRIKLAGAAVRIGRRSASRGITPEIDLAEPPADPGVSREHARLVAQPDGSWAVFDEGSTNGTYINSDPHRIPVNQQILLSDGDRVHVGVWTTITLVAEPSAPARGDLRRTGQHQVGATMTANGGTARYAKRAARWTGFAGCTGAVDRCGAYPSSCG